VTLADRAVARSPRARIGFSFAADGSDAVCLSAERSAPLVLERWSFSRPAPRREELSTEDGYSISTQVLALGAGRVVLVRPGVQQHRLALVEPTTTGLAERPLVTVEGAGVRLIDTPDPGALAIAVVDTGAGHSTLWRVLPGAPWLEWVAELPGTLVGGCWLDATGRRLGINQRQGGDCRPVAVDLHANAVRPLPGTSTGQYLLLTAPGSALTVFAGRVRDRMRLGHGLAGDGASPHFPHSLDDVPGSATPIAADPSGTQIALRVDRGVRSHLMIYTPRQDLLREVALPAGVILGSGNWSGHGLRFAYSAPRLPTGIATVGLRALSTGTASGDWTYVGEEPGDQSRWAQARVCRLDGPAGPIEAVVYGRDDWLDARHLVMALHGGPEAATRLAFDPLLQALAGAGITVVAPNYRGSTCYGRDHQQALHNAWGGPDLADIRHLARSWSRRRRPTDRLMLYGASYGAFLAMLAASADPHVWSHCAVVSPFLSGDRLYEDGSPGVRALLDRLGGRVDLDDDFGPRDVMRRCWRVSAQLLIIHSADDEVIPVGQSRALRECLLRAGRREGADFTYVEPVEGGHSPLEGDAGLGLTGALVRFLLRTGTPRHPRGGE